MSLEILTNIRRKFSYRSEARVAMAIDLSSSGEYTQAKDATPEFKVLRPGKKHKHELIDLPWRKKLGKDISHFSQYTATFKRLVGCKDKSCDLEAIISETALY